MRRVQKFIGVADSKPASAPVPSSSSNVAYPSGSYSSNPSGFTGSHTPASGSHSSDSQYGTANLQVPGSASQSYIGQLVAPSSPRDLSSSLRNSNPPSPMSSHRSASPLPQHGDYFAAIRTPRSVSPAPLAGSALASRPISPVQALNAVSPGLTPSASASNSGEGSAIERNDLHKTLKALESMLVNLDEYRDLSAKMAKVEKKLAKSASELEKVKSVQQAPSQTLAVSSDMFDALNEISAKHAKQVQKEYEALNDSCAKYFKKVAKEERAHEELVDSLDAKIKKANAAHEKSVKKATGTKALENHDKYIATVQGLTADISKAKSAHWTSMAAKSQSATLIAACTIGGLADLDFRRHCESVRRVGSHVGKLNEWLNFTSSEFMPTLQPADIEESELLHAQFLAKAEAQIQAYAEAQAEAQARVQEDFQAALRAQQMGWVPPSAASQRPDEGNALANLSQQSASGRVVEQATQPFFLNRPQSEETSSISADQASIQPRATETDAASIRSGAATAPQPPSQAKDSVSTDARNAADGPNEEDNRVESLPTETKAEASRSGSGLSVPGRSSANGGTRLERVPSGSKTRSPAPHAEMREQSSAANRSLEDRRGEPQRLQQNLPPSERVASSTDKDGSQLSPHGREGSSTAEGPIVDRLSVEPHEGSEATVPNLSRSTSAKGSEDGGRAPRTPSEGETLFAGPLAANAPGQERPSAELKTAESQAPIRGILENGSNSAPITSQARSAERALDRYRDVGEDAAAASRYPSNLGRNDGTSTYAQEVDAHPYNGDVGSKEEYSRVRKTSLWERERERMRQLERANELHDRLREEQVLRGDPHSAHTSVNSSTFSSRPTSSLHGGRSPQPYNGSEHERGANGETASGVYDPDRYAPSVGQSRLSGVSVNRTLSTDTTASERSFVSRMKARYQAEKEIERSNRELNVLEKERAARTMTMPPSADLAPVGARRVSEMAMRYMDESGGYARPQPQSSHLASKAYGHGEPASLMHRYHDSLLASSSVGGPRRLASPPPASQHGIGTLNEFGAYRDGPARGNRVSMPPRAPLSPPLREEPPHSDVCGCERCSVRHYGNPDASQRSQGPDSRPPVSRSGPRDPREFNVRRQSLPVRAGLDSGELQPPRYDTAGMYGRKSSDNLHDGQERKVAFAQTPQTIR